MMPPVRFLNEPTVTLTPPDNPVFTYSGGSSATMTPRKCLESCSSGKLMQVIAPWDKAGTGLNLF